MPCFKGLAVSIHTPDGPISEYSIQRQSRASRIACFIPVPPPKVPDSSSKGKPEQSTFAISITLLNPSQDVPYSTPKPTPDCPSPKPKVVGGLPSQTSERGQYSGAVAPYQALTNSPNETVAAYIYFDGRQKEEVATLLRRGEETWVNSRWVNSDDGGIAEREFLFREVGLERWLNGLDLEGKDAAAKIERRRQKMEKRRAKRQAENSGMDMELNSSKPKNIMRYGNDEKDPLENVSDDDLSSDSDDDDPIPETAGQIKVALFRVLASGEIKRGEYSPQFDAHDDDEGEQGGNSGGGGDADVDHTTSFAKPKSLDPKTISTQTVTGIDPTDKPYATFTFMYRGERQLQKMGIKKDQKPQETPNAKRKSLQADLSNLGALKPGGTVGFLNFRDQESGRKGSKGGDEMDSDDDDTDNPILSKADDEEGKDDDRFLSPDDIKRQGELEEGVRKIRLKRQHSAEPFNGSGAESTDTPASGTTPPAPERSITPPKAAASSAAPEQPIPTINGPDGFVGSPLKKQRASVSTADENALRRRIAESSGRISEVLGTGTGTGTATDSDSKSAQQAGSFGDKLNSTAPDSSKDDDDEEL
ncbi:hypothetical protein N7509_008564 [Penicillium cosmopolitanum]|uniref:DUF7918 domain-containing protein n=1 Tax=Penicillium cosmopolitanum TaxID=1131564 RepID=A0A9W9VMS8_9EURO|nr:uncharacterized protein N7509_008564 [Penicillium cosmopolitanum]KAJ5386023.1 hypothetical protein N7509_008564 [Penicillium cosmopolitanum]